MVDLLAIVGDTADNVPGVKGIGEKGAAKLIQQFGSLEEIYNNLDLISNKRIHKILQEQKENAFLSQELVKIKTDLSLGLSFEKADLYPFEKVLCDQNLLSFLDKYEPNFS